MIVGVATALACFAFGAETPAADRLNCLTLFPTPDLAAASGTIALLPAHSPFGAAVTVDGRTRYHLVATIAGLPSPRSLGNYTTYVAWAYTLTLDSAVNLGRVTNGRVDLGEVAFAQFRILISAERSASVRERQGRLVLRGTSPSARLLAHRDVLQPSAPGARLDTSRGVGGMAGMPDMGGGASFLPRPSTPRAEPGDSVIHVANGDTIALEARTISRTIAGSAVTIYGFNARSPGPRIEVTQGASIVVRFHNALDAESSIHWHGVRLDNRFDGAVGLTQAGVAPGASFAYTVHFPDAGIYWYHPHVREDVQQALGLYGNILVRSPAPRYYSPVNREEVLMLSDALIGHAGLTPFGEDAPTHALMGRFGNVFLVNGESRYAMDVKRGDVVRLFLTNASSARMYNLSFASDDVRMKVVAGDGGKFEHEAWVRSLVIAPAERYVVEVAFPRGGTVALVNRVQALDHMIGTFTPEVDTLALVRVARDSAVVRYTSQFVTLRQNADVRAELAPLRRYFDKPVDHTLILTLRTHDLPAAAANMLIGINAALDWNDGMPMVNAPMTSKEVSWILRDPATGKENMDIDWHFRRGDIVKLRLYNDPATSHAMSHPIHLHGQRFLVLSRDGVASDNLVWKDTAIVPAGETVDLLVDMSNPGRWMIHCHIAEHLSAGMMAAFTVE